VIGARHVVGGAAYILGAVTEPGVVDANGPRSIVIGELSGPPSDRVRAIRDVGARAGLTVGIAEDIRVALWEKYTLLVAFSAMTGTVRLPIGAIRDAPAAKAMLRALMTEVWTIGRAAGVELADGLVDQEMNRLLSQHDGATTSLYHDLVTGHRMELEALQGAAIRIGSEHRVPTPNLDAAYAILQPWALRNERPADDRTTIPT
jgi:2-dehydropantoate 2-reductase